jgi:hypothetical protein
MGHCSAANIGAGANHVPYNIIVIGFADPARGIEDAAARVHRRAWKRGSVVGGGAGAAARCR